MFFGRNEECGLRCVYHGWKFDRNGTCVDMPSEPPDSLFKTKVRSRRIPPGKAATWSGPISGRPNCAPPRRITSCCARPRDAPLRFEVVRRVQFSAGARGRHRPDARDDHAQQAHRRPLVPQQLRAPRRRTRPRENRLRLHVRGHSQPRVANVDARLPLDHAVVSHARPRRGQLPPIPKDDASADDRRPHLDPDRRRKHVGLQLHVLARSGAPAPARTSARSGNAPRSRRLSRRALRRGSTVPTITASTATCRRPRR